MAKPIAITRDELYKLVWSNPVSKLAERFGLSDKGLAKKCARHNIPCPPLGYWAKKQHGHEPPKTPLPQNTDSDLDTVMFWPKAKPSSDDPKLKQSYLSDTDLETVLRFKPLSKSDKYHPAITACLEAYKKEAKEKKVRIFSSAIDKYGRVNRVKDIGLKVTPQTLERACVYLNSLIILFKGLGWAYTRKNNHTYGFEFNDEIITIEIKEPVKQFKIHHSKSSRKRVFLSAHDEDRYHVEFKPTNKLEFSINSYSREFKTFWKDNDKKLLEQNFIDIAQSFSCAFEHSRLQTIRYEAAYREEKKREEQRQKERRSSQIEQDCRQQLTQLAKQFDEFSKINRLVHALNKSENKDERLMNWLSWANQVMNELDPLTQQEEFLDKYENTRKHQY